MTEQTEKITCPIKTRLSFPNTACKDPVQMDCANCWICQHFEWKEQN